MKRKCFERLIVVIMAAGFFATTLPVIPVKASIEKNTGKTYYVSSTKGSDSNNGEFESKPFKTLNKINEITLGPGDQVLLEKGSIFNDQYLHLKGSGSAGAPIKIATYGSGNRPQIHTNGNGKWEQDYGRPLANLKHKYKGTVSSSILLRDVEYIEIKGLEITNNGPDGNKVYNDPNFINRTGVAGFAKDKGTLEHIVLDDLYIHDVVGNVYDKHMLNGGIYFGAALATDEKKTGIPRFDGLVIKNCYLDTVNRWGIAAAYTAYYDKFKGKEISDDICKTYGSTNVVIENNYIKDAGGDGITPMYCYKPLIQNNVSYGAARQINFKDYSATDFGRVAAGIWPWKCKNALFQYNECYFTRNAENGNGDGQAWDADSGDGTVYQYNYSYGNTGGTVMFCLGEAYRSTFRYNISENDEMGIINAPSQPDAHVYNNTFFIKEGVPIIRGNMNNGVTKMENNIFYYTGETPRKEKWDYPNKIYNNNLYYNYEDLPNDSNAIKVDAGTSIFENPGNAPSSTTGVINPHTDPNVATVFDGYKLAKNSLAINAGKVIKDDNGIAIEHDFLGNPISIVPEIGAIESNSDASIHNTIFRQMGNALQVPSTSKNPITVGNIKSGITIAKTASIRIMEGEKEIQKGPVTENMVVRIIAENGQYVNYPIEIKNEYQWALDYTGKQGNVWFTQIRNSDTEYENLTEYDPTFPNWVVDKFYGAGIAEKRQDIAPTESTHGLLIDTVKESKKKGMAMAFRVPKNGVVSISFKDDEPNLRKPNNSGGKVVVKLTVNGIEKQRCELAESQKAGQFSNIPRLEVKKGDYIRIEAQNIANPSEPSVYITPKITYLDEADPF